jgi:hypothetical protein|tara:strand:- start:816 stop:1130 length:315 start_codon:yes stop_codon:yes gene_type:complete
MAISIFWGLLFNMNNDLAPRLRSFSSAFALPLDKAIRAVSDAEKKAEQNNRSTKHMPPNIILGLRRYRDLPKTEVQILRLPTVILSLRVKQQRITGSAPSVFDK